MTALFGAGSKGGTTTVPRRRPTNLLSICLDLPQGTLREVYPAGEPLSDRWASSMQRAKERLSFSTRLELAQQLLADQGEISADDIVTQQGVCKKYGQEMLRALHELGKVRRIEQGVTVLWAAA